MIPRLRMFAGPNGSGKSTIKEAIKSELLGIYVNPDEVEKELKIQGYLNFEDFHITVTEKEVITYFSQSVLLQKQQLEDVAKKIKFENNCLFFHALEINSYYASVLCDFIRQQLLLSKVSFTFETVMSSPDKVDFLAKAQQNNYKTYLYFVATEDPLINVSRVSQRVRKGGHNVPNEKIIARYYRSMDLLVDAIKHTSRAYIFDNSGLQQVWIAEITDGKIIEIKSSDVPEWFQKHVIEKL